MKNQDRYLKVCNFYFQKPENASKIVKCLWSDHWTIVPLDHWFCRKIGFKTLVSQLDKQQKVISETIFIVYSALFQKREYICSSLLFIYPCKWFMLTLSFIAFIFTTSVTVQWMILWGNLNCLLLYRQMLIT